MNLLNYIQFALIFFLLFMLDLWRFRALKAEEELRKLK